VDHTQPHPEFYNLPGTTDEFNGMPYRWLGRTGLRVSPTALGLWKLGYPETGDGSRLDEAAGFRLFDRALELGVTFWDTANRYTGSAGNSERIIGKWFKRNPDRRRDIVLATKCWGLMDGRTPNHCRLSRTNILESVYASLERLQLDYVDLLYFHVFDPDTPADESLAAVEDLIRWDLVRYFAVSNFTVDQLKFYQALLPHFSVRCRLAAVQNEFNILHGETPPYQGVLEYAAADGIAFVPYSALAQGLLSERYLDPAQARPGDRLYDEGRLEAQAASPAMAKVRRLAGLARAWALPLSQLALAYTLGLPGMGPVITAVSSVEQLESNAAAARLTLTGDQREQVQAALMESPPAPA
jgi:aryl-alcohol dehydrogenase-like predicted oxidoreductase